MDLQSTYDDFDFSVDATTDFLPGASILIKDGEPAAKPTMPQNRFLKSLPIIFWGVGNDYPQQVIMNANKSAELLALLNFVVYFLYGGGLTYEVIENPTAKGKPTYIETYDDEVEAWMTGNCINDYLLESIIDLVWFNHGFSELIKNKKGDKIVQIAYQEAAFCRFGRQNDQGFSDKVYINGNWPNGNFIDSQYTSIVDCINIKDINKVKTVYDANYAKFVYPVSFPSPGAITYNAPAWHALFESGYFDVALMIPILKRALMKFTMTIKYVIEVPQLFWEKRAEEKGKVWAELTGAEKKALRKEVNREMNDFLTGAENAGKSFLSTYGWDKQHATKIPGITITALDDKLKDGAWIEDGHESSAQFIRAMNLTPEVVGHFTGKGMGAGSGSGSRVQGNMVNNLMLSRRDKILSPLTFIAQYNGWTTRLPGFRWKIREFQFDTLDVNHSTSNPKPSNPPADVQSDQ